jgi:hypothetical protein
VEVIDGLKTRAEDDVAWFEQQLVLGPLHPD